MLHLHRIRSGIPSLAGLRPVGQEGSYRTIPRLKLAGLFPAVVTLSFLSCDPGEIDLVSPEGSTAEVPALTVRAILGDSHQDLAMTLGWADGIPDAMVRVHKEDEPYDEGYWVHAETDVSGTASFSDLLPGIYEIEIARAIHPDEAEASGGSVQVMAGGVWLRVPRNAPEDVAIVPNQVSGLVFSEVAVIKPLPWETGGPTYTDGVYLELFNNSEQTVFLDGMILGFAWDKYHEYPVGWTCALSFPFRTDPEGVWARRFLRFPGSGTEHPVMPGETVLIARSAIDHTPVHPSLEDLSTADWEFGLSGAAGNPDVPDLSIVGLEGLRINDPMFGNPLFLSRPVDTESLPRLTESWSGRTYLRFPREEIIDVTIGAVDFTKSSFETAAPCSQAIDPHFETLPGPALWSASDGPAWTAQRRVLFTADGRKILQDTNTSMADFVRAWKTPGWIPDTIPDGR